MRATDALGSLDRLWRYYQAGIVNTVFGYGMYALLVALGLNMYLAQIIAHTLGVGFNYFTYSRHAFRDAEASKTRFVLSYVVNYLLGLGALAAAAQFFKSPFVAGAVAVVVVSFINYFILKHFVFTRPASD
ncbi:MAG: GtrA family protein [Sphingomicrobium sp.]